MIRSDRPSEAEHADPARPKRDFCVFHAASVRVRFGHFASLHWLRKEPELAGSVGKLLELL